MGKGKENNKVKQILGKNVRAIVTDELFPYPVPYLVNFVFISSTWFSPYQLKLILTLLTLVCKEVTLFSVPFGRGFLGTMERAQKVGPLSWLAEERR